LYVGCGHGIAFGAINLTHVVEKIPTLVGPTVKNLIVLSDDSLWVESQIQIMKKRDPRWNIYTLLPPKPDFLPKKQDGEPYAGSLLFYHGLL
jgi:hypothetical protein